MSLNFSAYILNLIHKLTVLLFILLLLGCQKPANFYPQGIINGVENQIFKKYSHPVNVALVLGGGGVRGMAHVGVLEVLQKEHVPIDLIVGCSAGSIVGALYADCVDADTVKSLLIKKMRKDFISINLLKCRFGLFHRKPFIYFLNQYLGQKTFEDLNIPLVVVATDLHTGELVAYNTGLISPTIHASCAVPFYFSPIRYNNRTLIDGGIADPVPVNVARNLGAKFVIAVNIEASLDHDNPYHLIDVAVQSAMIKHMQHVRLCIKDADIVIRPQVGHIGMFDEKSNAELYQAGKEAAEKILPEIKKLLSITENNQ